MLHQLEINSEYVFLTFLVLMSLSKYDSKTGDQCLRFRPLERLTQLRRRGNGELCIMNKVLGSEDDIRIKHQPMPADTLHAEEDLIDRLNADFISTS